MGAPLKQRRTPTPPDPITTTRASALHSETKYRYQRWAASRDRLDEEARLIMAGARPNLKRLQKLQEETQLRYEVLLHYLTEAARRVRVQDPHSRTDDGTYAEYLHTAAQRIALSAVENNKTF